MTKSWLYYKNNQLMKLNYTRSEMDIMVRNPITMIREIQHQVHDKFFEFCFDKGYDVYIKDINMWLQENLNFIIDSNQIYNKNMDIVKYITSEIGEYQFASTYEMGWNAPNLLKLTINLYNGEMTLNYKNKDIQLNEEKLKLFIQKNKETIFKAREREHQKHMKKVQQMREEEKMKQLEEETRLLNISKPDIDATKKVGYNSKSSGIFIPRTLKQRYEAQACKPFPVKYPWNSKNMDIDFKF